MYYLTVPLFWKSGHSMPVFSAQGLTELKSRYLARAAFLIRGQGVFQFHSGFWKNLIFFCCWLGTALSFQRLPRVPCHVAPKGGSQDDCLLSFKPAGTSHSDFLFLTSWKKLPAFKCWCNWVSPTQKITLS